MRQRFILAGLMVSLIGVVAALAQPPAVVVHPADPATPTAPCTSSPSAEKLPASNTDAPLARFEPLIAHPHQTQAAVRAVLLGASWLTRMNQSQGRFLYAYNPALRQPIPGDHDLHQARAALALAQCARFSGDEKQGALASQAILALLAVTKIDAADPNCRIPLPLAPSCNRVGFAALLALSIYELPTPDPKLVAEAERLCTFLRKQCRPDGSVHYAEGTNGDPLKLDPAGINEYPGTALHAILAGNRIQPAAWKVEVAVKGLAYYSAKFKANPHPLLAASLSPVCAALFQQTKSAEVTTAIFEMNDWLCGLQITPTDPRTPQWAGAFRAFSDGKLADEPPSAEVGLYVQSLALAYQINRHVPDLARNERYKSALLESTRFICSLQYLESNTRHFENTFRAHMLIGGFHLSPMDGTLRIEATGTAITGLLAFLSSGAEKP
jgi:hypothetical protein